MDNNSQIIKQFYCKANNRRVFIELFYFKEENAYLFRVITKTLKDRLKRDIFITINWYSPETFFLINDLMNDFIDNQLKSVVFPKRLKAEVSNFNIIKEHINETNNLHFR